MGQVENEIEGAYPQSCEQDARGVSLTRPERTFLDLTLSALSDDPFSGSTPEQVARAREEANLSEEHAKFIYNWIRSHGDLIAMTEESECEPAKLQRYLSVPSVIRILTEAANRYPNLPPPIPTKEELAVAWGAVSRMPYLPQQTLKEARQELAKLMGYYPDGGKGAGAANIQINLVNPYGKVEVVGEASRG